MCARWHPLWNGARITAAATFKNYKRTTRQTYFEIAKDASAVVLATGAMATADLWKKWLKQNQKLGFHFIWFHLDCDISWAVRTDILYRLPPLARAVSQNLSKSYLSTFIRNGHRKCLIPECLVSVHALKCHAYTNTHRLANTEIDQMKRNETNHDICTTNWEIGKATTQSIDAIKLIWPPLWTISSSSSISAATTTANKAMRYKWRTAVNSNVFLSLSLSFNGQSYREMVIYLSFIRKTAHYFICVYPHFAVFFISSFSLVCSDVIQRNCKADRADNGNDNSSKYCFIISISITKSNWFVNCNTQTWHHHPFIFWHIESTQVV